MTQICVISHVQISTIASRFFHADRIQMQFSPKVFLTRFQFFYLFVIYMVLYNCQCFVWRFKSQTATLFTKLWKIRIYISRCTKHKFPTIHCIPLKTSMAISAIFLSAVFFLIYGNGVLPIEATHHVYRNLQTLSSHSSDNQPYRTAYHFQPPKNWINGTI